MIDTRPAKLAVSRRLRSTPYTPRVEALGVSDYSIVNHTVLPKGFGRSVEDDYWHLKTQVQLWDVSCQRQVELKGDDAARLMQLMTPRNMQAAEVGQCLYVPIIDDKAGMLNDPVVLKLSQDHYWLSIADSDVLLWAKGLAVGLGLRVNISEPDVSPLAVQGPKAEQLMERVFGSEVRNIAFFRFKRLEFKGRPLVIARSGYSRQGGFEIYLDDSSLGLDLWDTLWDAGSDLNIRPGSPNLIERVEGGLLSYGNEFTQANNPLECGMEKYCSLDGEFDYIGKEALTRIAKQGIKRLIKGVVFDGGKCPPCAFAWPLFVDDREVGQVTTAIWSPDKRANVSLGMLDRGYWNAGQCVSVKCSDGTVRTGTVHDLPL